WHASWHRTMTQKVGPQTVIAEFDGRVLPHSDGEHAVARRSAGGEERARRAATTSGAELKTNPDGDEFWVRMPDANWLLERAAKGPEAVPAEIPMQWQRV